MYTSFAKAITVIDGDARLASGRPFESNKQFIDFPKLGNILPIPINCIEQRRTWKFNVRHNLGYAVEVYTTQTVDVNGESLRPRQERWGVQMYHEDWDVLFHQNQGLDIGQQTRWEPTEAQFFPFDGHNWAHDRDGMTCEPGRGIATLMGVMDELAEVIVEDTEQKKPAPVSKKVVHAAVPKTQAHFTSTSKGLASSVTSGNAISNPKQSATIKGEERVAVSEVRRPEDSLSVGILNKGNRRYFPANQRPNSQTTIARKSVEPDPLLKPVYIHCFPPDGQASVSTACPAPLPSLPNLSSVQGGNNLNPIDNDPFGDPISVLSAYPPMIPFRRKEADKAKAEQQPDHEGKDEQSLPRLAQFHYEKDAGIATINTMDVAFLEEFEAESVIRMESELEEDYESSL
jgi:hypothetical protein